MTVKNISIMAERENELLERRELRLLVEYEGGQPSRGELLELISTKFKVPRESTVIIKVASTFGANTAIVESRVYRSREAMLSTEPRYILARNGHIEKKREEQKA